jgi:hypothetical protein
MVCHYLFLQAKNQEFRFLAALAGVAEFGRRTGLKILWELVPVPVRVRPSVLKIIKNEEFTIKIEMKTKILNSSFLIMN